MQDTIINSNVHSTSVYGKCKGKISKAEDIMEELQKLDGNTFIQMLAEIYGWRHVNGKLPEGGRVVKLKRTVAN